MSSEPVYVGKEDAKNATFHKYDLTTTFMKYLDPQLSILMIDFISGKKLYPEVEVLYGKMKLLMKTFCVAKAEETFAKLKELNAEKSQIEQLEKELEEMKKKYEKEKTAVETQWEGTKVLFENEELMAVVNGTKKLGDSVTAEDGTVEEESIPVNAKTLAKTFGVNVAALTAFLRYIRFLYRSGDYQTAFELLQKFLAISKYFADDASSLRGKALWSRLACDILLNRLNEGFADIDALRNFIESLASKMRDDPRVASHLQLLYMRVWLMHWSLFVYMRSPEHLQDGKDKLAELFQNVQYMNALQTEAPHLVRYLAVAFVTNKRKQRSMEALVRNVRQVSYMYTDSLTNFIDHMNVADFDGALASLTECRENLFPYDMIVESFQNEFVQCARFLLFSNFVRAHRRIDVPTLANKLSLSEKEVEQWVVDLIRNNSRLDARIDSAANQMIFGTQQQSVYQSVIEDTKELCKNAEELASFLDEFTETGSIPSVGMGRYRRG